MKTILTTILSLVIFFGAVPAVQAVPARCAYSSEMTCEMACADEDIKKKKKKGKKLALNVANTKQYKTFEEDTVQLALDVGLEHTDTWWLSLSTQQGGSTTTTLEGDSVDKKQENRYLGKFERPNLSGRKFEPTFIFTK